MTERIPEKSDLREVVIRVAQNPHRFLERNFDKGAKAAILFLRQVRNQIKQDATYVVQNPDPYFKDFYQRRDDSIEHYVALFTLLKQAGYSKTDVLSAAMDSLPTKVVDETMDRSTAVRLFVSLNEEAAHQVYE